MLRLLTKAIEKNSIQKKCKYCVEFKAFDPFGGLFWRVTATTAPINVIHLPRLFFFNLGAANIPILMQKYINNILYIVWEVFE